MNSLDWMLASSIGELLNAVMLACLFWVALGHPGKIRNFYSFRAAQWIFGLSLIVPTMARLLIIGATIGGGRVGASVEGALMQVLAEALASVGFVAASLLALGSITPRVDRSRDSLSPGLPADVMGPDRLRSSS